VLMVVSLVQVKVTLLSLLPLLWASRHFRFHQSTSDRKDEGWRGQFKYKGHMLRTRKFADADQSKAITAIDR